MPAAMPAPATPADLQGQRVLGWRVRDGALLLTLATRGEVPCVCPCGRAHLLPTEEAPTRILLLHCHGCGRAGELRLE